MTGAAWWDAEMANPLHPSTNGCAEDCGGCPVPCDPDAEETVPLLRDFDDVRADVDRIYPGFADLPWHGEMRTGPSWLKIAQAVLGDPDEVVTFKLNGGRSGGANPQEGNQLKLNANEIEIIHHEMAHFLGVGGHMWSTAKSADNWSLWYCPTALGPVFYSSRASWSSSCSRPMKTIVEAEDVEAPSTDWPEYCEFSETDTRCAGVVTESGKYLHWFRQAERDHVGGDIVFKYRSCYTDPTDGMGICAFEGPDSDPENIAIAADQPTYRFNDEGVITSYYYGVQHYSSPPRAGETVWRLNAMAYDNGLLPDPHARMLAPSQLEAAIDGMNSNVQFQAAVRDRFRVGGVATGALLPGVTSSMLYSKRNQLGTSTEDLLWWGNGDDSFTYRNRPVTGTNYTPVAADLDANGWDDVIFFDPGMGTANILFGGPNGFYTSTSVDFEVAPGYTLFVGNFDGQAGDDIYLYKSGSSPEKVYWSTAYSTNVAGWTTTSPNVSTSYVPVVGNFDGQHGDDIYWYNKWLGTVVKSMSTGTKTFPTLVANESFGTSHPYVPIVGDFEGDGRDDIFWYRAGSGNQSIVWYHRATSRFVSSRHIGGVYETPFAGDFDGDGDDDIFWENSGNDRDYIWDSSGLSFNSLDVQMHGTFKPVAGDFGKGPSGCTTCDDIFWYRQ